jgi:hypothetical protein
VTQKKLAKAGTGHTTPLNDKKPQTIKVDYRSIRKTENQEYLKNVNVKAFLGAIAWSEGGGYDFKFGAVKGKAHDKWRFPTFPRIRVLAPMAIPLRLACIRSRKMSGSSTA